MYQRLITILVLFFGLHLFLYLSALRFFNVSGKALKKALLLAILFLSLSFIASAILIRLSLNPLTRALYILGASWTGLAVNFVMAALACWAIALSAFIIKRGRVPSMRPVYAAVFAAATLFSAYGVWNALHPRVKNIEVEMPGLPEAWRDKTIVQISDVHLGAIYTPRYFARMADRINSLRPDVIFITGDLFDSISADGLEPFAWALDRLEAKDGVFYVNGNHENYIGIGAVLSVLARTKIRALHDEAVSIGGVQILGVDYPESGGYRSVVGKLLSSGGFKKGAPTILLYHTPTNIEPGKEPAGNHRVRTYWNPDLDFSAARALGVNLQLSGHTHRGQMVPFIFLARYIYKGYEYGLNSEEGFSIYTTSGLGTFGPPMRTGSPPEIVLIRLKPAK